MNLSRRTPLAVHSRGIEPLESRRLLSGTLDTSFGIGGRVVTDFPNDFFDQALSPALQSDGKIIAQAASTTNSSRLIRCTANGQLDPSFGSNGVRFVTHAPGALAVRGDDRIVVVTQNSPDTILISRYTANGQVDTTFGGGTGDVTQPFFGGAQTSTKLIAKILVRPDNGRIYVVGSVDPYDSGLYQFAVSAYNADGTPYQEFGDNPTGLPNTTLTSFGYTNFLADAVLTPDGHIDAVGTLTVSDSHHPDVQQDFAVARYDEHGVLDPTFAGDGKLLINFGDYPRTGNYETSDAFDQARSAALDAAGNLLIAGTSRDPSDDNPFFSALARVKPDGLLDPTFGPGGADGDGLVTLPLGIPADSFSANQVALLPTGKILLATDPNMGAGDLSLSLLNSSGSPDTTFGTAGKLAVDFGPGNDFHGTLLIQSGKPLLVGGIWPAGESTASLAMARYLVGEAQTPYANTPFQLPGTVQLENYDKGGEGVAYHDTDAVNQGGTYRTESADVQPIPASSGGGHSLAFTRPGEWTEYTFNAAPDKAGWYDLVLRYAAPRAGGTFRLDLDGKAILAPTPLPATGDWQAYGTLAFRGMYFTPGTHVLRLSQYNAGSYGYVANFDSLAFTRHREPVHLTPFNPGAIIQAEDYDAGSEGNTYHDTEPANLGNVTYRTIGLIPDGVDIEQTTTPAGFRYNVGYAKAGEWLEYTLSGPATATTYALDVTLASLRAGGRFQFTLDGKPVASFTAPATGSWQAYTTLRSSTTIALTPGLHVLRLVMDQNNSTGYVANFDWLRLVTTA